MDKTSGKGVIDQPPLPPAKRTLFIESQRRPAIPQSVPVDHVARMAAQMTTFRMKVTGSPKRKSYKPCSKLVSLYINLIQNLYSIDSDTLKF